MKSLTYIDTLDRNVGIHTIGKTYKVRHTMRELEAMLKNETRFVRSHAAYIVNIQYIASINSSEIILRNNESVLLSKYKKREFMESVLEYSKSSKWF